MVRDLMPKSSAVANSSSPASTSGEPVPTACAPLHGCRSTRIFCLPTCRYDTRVLDRNRVVFTDADAALGAGYRPCKVCRPV
ncbi:MAG TPA: Ada metal-binding domain-containing protein [Chloroflexota bacterium]|nr:Ada metal-binding domain-containing protein [Chloroflexota bacterium]